MAPEHLWASVPKLNYQGCIGVIQEFSTGSWTMIYRKMLRGPWVSASGYQKITIQAQCLRWTTATYKYHSLGHSCCRSTKLININIFKCLLYHCLILARKKKNNPKPNNKKTPQNKGLASSSLLLSAPCRHSLHCQHYFLLRMGGHNVEDIKSTRFWVHHTPLNKFPPSCANSDSAGTKPDTRHQKRKLTCTTAHHREFPRLFPKFQRATCNCMWKERIIISFTRLKALFAFLFFHKI